MSEPDFIRKYVEAHLGENLKAASLAIGQNETYLHQYLRYHKPVRLKEEVREAMVRVYGLDAEALRSQAAAKAALAGGVKPSLTTKPPKSARSDVGEKKDEAMTDTSELMLLEAYRELAPKAKLALLRMALDFKSETPTSHPQTRARR